MIPVISIDATNFVYKRKLFNNFKYTTFIWSYKIKYDYFITEQVV